MNRLLLAVGLCLLPLTGIHAQQPKFIFKAGDVLSYRIVQTTAIDEVLIDDQTMKPTTRSINTSLTLIRDWKVTEVDAQGVATLEMQIRQMLWKQKIGDGEEDVFDSQKPDELNKNVMAKNIGKVLAILRVDSAGKVVEVKQSNVGAAHRFNSDIPFKVMFSTEATKEGWSRDYAIQLDPPHGTGEKFAAKQTYKIMEGQNGLQIYNLTTEIADLPKKSADQIPLLPLMQTGPVFFHLETGRYYGCRLKSSRILNNHQGEGTSYSYQSGYSEDLVAAPK